MGGSDETCDTGLHLGIGFGDFNVAQSNVQNKNKRVICLDLALIPVHPKEEAIEDAIYKHVKQANKENRNKDYGRKKLRLTKEQSNQLEDNFELNNTPNMAQKQELAERLNLRPRQVEVWFQNRRARTKLKQTKVDCEVLKKCCESLRGENERLKKELQDLRRSLKLAQPPPPPFYHLRLPTNCPSCCKVGKTRGVVRHATDEDFSAAVHVVPN